MQSDKTRDNTKNGLCDRVKRTLFFRFYKNSCLFRRLVDKDRKKAVGLMWEMTFGTDFPWDCPRTLNEKISWMAANTDISLWSEYSDKYAVREYVKRLGLSRILTECYGVWDSFDEIRFDGLPDQFVLKCTHDCGSTVLVRDKSAMNMKETRKFMNSHMKKRMGYETCEPHYTRIKPRIMAEELIEGDGGFCSHSIVDYKIWCLGNKAGYVFIAYDRYLDSENSAGVIFDLYDAKTWEPLTRYLSPEYRAKAVRPVPRPEHLEEMIEIAERLSSGFPQVRVDLYDTGGKIRFGELTFTSNGGRMKYFTDEFQRILGDELNIDDMMDTKTER